MTAAAGELITAAQSDLARAYALLESGGDELAALAVLARGAERADRAVGLLLERRRSVLNTHGGYATVDSTPTKERR